MGIGKERGFVGLLDYVEGKNSGDVQQLKDAIQKIWNTLSTDWQLNGGAVPDVKTQLLNLSTAISGFQTIIVDEKTQASLRILGIYTSSVEEILIDLARLIGESKKEAIEQATKLVGDLKEALDAQKQDKQLSQETITALKLGDNVDTVEEALIAINNNGANIMCDDAQRWYEEEYHKKFNTTYALNCRMDGGGTINPQSESTHTFTLKATITGTVTLNSPGGSESKSLSFATSPTVSGWTLDEAASSATTKTYIKTVTVSENGADGFNFKKNQTYSFPSTTFTYYKWDPVSKTQTTEVGTDAKDGSTSVTITRGDFYWNNVMSLDADGFYNGIKVATKTYTGTFSNGKNPIKTIDKMPLIFASTNGSHKFEQFTASIIVDKISFDTPLGTYYIYKSQPANGSDWSVEVS